MCISSKTYGEGIDGNNNNYTHCQWQFLAVSKGLKLQELQDTFNKQGDEAHQEIQ